MHVLDTITITFAGLMVGNELAVSAFFQSCHLAVRVHSTSARIVYSRRFSGSGDACLVWIVSGTLGAGVIPASE